MDKLRDWKNKLSEIETIDDYMKYRDNLELND